MPLATENYPELPIEAYEKVRNELRSGDLIFCSGSARISELIKQFTGSVWSHVAMVLRLENLNRVLVLESVESVGVRMVPLSNYIVNYQNTHQSYPGRVYVARHTQVDEYNVREMATFGLNLLGKPYDREEIIRIMSRITNLSHVSSLQRNTEYICSELIYECFQWVGIGMKTNPQGFIAPSDIAIDEHIKGMYELMLPHNS
jgi:hypothetical protein